MYYIIRYRLTKSDEDTIVTCLGEQQMSLLVKKIKAMDVEYLDIYEMKYRLDLTEEV